MLGCQILMCISTAFATLAGTERPEVTTKLAGQHPATSPSQTQTRLRQARSVENMEFMETLNRKPWS